MSLEVFGTAEAALPLGSADHPTMHSQESPSFLLAAFPFEKAEEETEMSDEEKGRMARVLLLDFSQVVFSISLHHTLQIQFTAHTFLYHVRPPLDELGCVSQI
jgi:hypothetical protein